MFYLILKQIIVVTHNVINKNMAEKIFINNNIFAGYLHYMDTCVVSMIVVFNIK